MSTIHIRLHNVRGGQKRLDRGDIARGHLGLCSRVTGILAPMFVDRVLGRTSSSLSSNEYPRFLEAEDRTGHYIKPQLTGVEEHKPDHVPDHVDSARSGARIRRIENPICDYIICIKDRERDVDTPTRG
jgi:hypothetical protein